jgi:aldehyde:ferredoxin oxidoreductase
MPSRTPGSFGYQGKWAWVDLTGRTVRVEPADASVCEKYLGGRGVQARLIADHVDRCGSPLDPMSADSRLVIGTGPLNDTPLATAGRGSCSFISPLTRSPGPAPWIPNHVPLYGLLTHSSAGGVFPDMLKRTGIDQLVIDGRADRPVRLFVSEREIEIVDAEDDLFDRAHGRPVTVRGTSETTEWLTAKYPSSATMAVGPAGWNRVAYACLTGDHHRNFGRGGAGAVVAAKNLVAVTAHGRRPVTPRDAAAFDRLVRELNELVKERALDRERTTSFRPTTGTTWWLDRAFDGRYMGKSGGYLPWHNFDEGYFDPAVYAAVGTDAFLAIAGKPKVCNRCRHVMCTRAAHIDSGPFAGDGVRPEFETVALWINCCIADRAAIFHVNGRCNDLGVDTMTFGSVLAAAMEMNERGALEGIEDAPRFGSADDMVRTLNAIASGSGDLGQALGKAADTMIGDLGVLRRSGGGSGDIAACVTTAFGGMGYAGIEPKVFPGMFAAYATSNRGRGDHSYAWTVQAEEDGLKEPEQLAAYVSESQRGKALIDSLGLCDFFPADVASERFLTMYRALTGREYEADELLRCGERIYALERHVNNRQGRTRAYDAYVHPKLTVPLTAGPHAGKSVDVRTHNAVLDAYYARNGWNPDGIVGAARLSELGGG